MVHEYTPFVNNPRSSVQRRGDRIRVVNEQTFRTARFRGIWEQAGFGGFHDGQLPAKTQNDGPAIFCGRSFPVARVGEQPTQKLQPNPYSNNNRQCRGREFRIVF